MPPVERPPPNEPPEGRPPPNELPPERPPNELPEEREGELEGLGLKVRLGVLLERPPNEGALFSLFRRSTVVRVELRRLLLVRLPKVRLLPEFDGLLTLTGCWLTRPPKDRLLLLLLRVPTLLGWLTRPPKERLGSLPRMFVLRLG